MLAMHKTLPYITLSLLCCTLTQASNTESNTPLQTSDANLTKQNIQRIKTPSGEVEITLPKVPTVPMPPKAIELESDNRADRSIKFSKRTPPNYKPRSLDKEKAGKVSANTNIGHVNQGRISAYLRGPFMDVQTVEAKLTSAGFTLLVSTPVNKKGTLTSVVFTSESLLAMAGKHKRGFMATLRVLVDTQEKNISITNPLYLAKGFMQAEFDEKITTDILVKLLEIFPDVTNSKDALKFQLLPKYQFMNGMPQYKDMIEVASGTDLIERIQNNKKVLFRQTLNNGATIIGIRLGKRTRKFTKRIGRNNAGLLPYVVVIEEGKAYILDPKFYLAYMYPLLRMSEFMTIATIPDAIVNDAKRVFRKKK